jgi:hypothetical protein
MKKLKTILLLAVIAAQTNAVRCWNPFSSFSNFSNRFSGFSGLFSKSSATEKEMTEVAAQVLPTTSDAQSKKEENVLTRFWRAMRERLGVFPNSQAPSDGVYEDSATAPTLVESTLPPSGTGCHTPHPLSTSET